MSSAEPRRAPDGIPNTLRSPISPCGRFFSQQGPAPASSGGAEGKHPLDVPCHGHEAPLAAHLVEPAQQELAESEYRFDDAEHWFRGLFAKAALAMRSTPRMNALEPHRRTLTPDLHIRAGSVLDRLELAAADGARRYRRRCRASNCRSRRRPTTRCVSRVGRGSRRATTW